MNFIRKAAATSFLVSALFMGIHPDTISHVGQQVYTQTANEKMNKQNQNGGEGDPESATTEEQEQVPFQAGTSA